MHLYIGMKKPTPAILYAVTAALCYAMSTPLSKLLLGNISPVMMAALLYLGAGIGMSFVFLLQGRTSTKPAEARLTKKELPYTILMILLDIAAPVLLMLGLATSNAAAVSLLNNFEIVATTLIALLVFKESIGKRMWISIALITLSCIVLSVEDFAGMQFSSGLLFVLAACLCWGLENNCTRMMSLKNPVQIVVIKGLGSGLGALIISLVTERTIPKIPYIFMALALGFVAYGLSIYFYILAQRHLGAARTSAYYAIAPFVGTALSFIILQENITLAFVAAFAIMAAGAYLASSEKHSHNHVHAPVQHEHRHRHDDMHHTHTHAHPVKGYHSHPHTHQPMQHSHLHTPDMHHQHQH